MNRLPREDSVGLVDWWVGCRFHGAVAQAVVVPQDWVDVVVVKECLGSRQVIRLRPGHFEGFQGWFGALGLGKTGGQAELLEVRTRVILILDLGGRFVGGI